MSLYNLNLILKITPKYLIKKSYLHLYLSPHSATAVFLVSIPIPLDGQFDGFAFGLEPALPHDLNHHRFDHFVNAHCRLGASLAELHLNHNSLTPRVVANSSACSALTYLDCSRSILFPTRVSVIFYFTQF
jgi:hypothetical protein